MNSERLLSELTPFLSHSPTVTLPHASFKHLYDHLARNILLAKQIPNLKKLLAGFSDVRKNMQLVSSSVQSTSFFLTDSLMSVAREFAALRGNYLYILIQLNSSYSFVREQLTKVTELIENSMYAFNEDTKNNGASKRLHSRTLVLLKPIKQFVEVALQKISATDSELKSAELAKGVPFSILMKERSELNTHEKKMVEILLKDQTVDVKLLKQRLKSAHASKEKLGSQIPSSDASCSVTELEDFLYNLLHGRKETTSKQFTKDVSLKDLLAITREIEEGESSPIGTTAGCLKDIEAIIKQPKPEFDPKKIKKIEFSDNKIGEQLEEIKSPSTRIANDSIDAIALSSMLRNQPIEEILRHEEYVKQCKDGDAIPGSVVLESFDLPDESCEDYPSLKSTQEILYKRPLKESKQEMCRDYRAQKGLIENYKENSKVEKKISAKEGKIKSSVKKSTEAAYWPNSNSNHSDSKASKHNFNSEIKSISVLSIEGNEGENNKSLKLKRDEKGIIKLPVLVDDKRDHLSAKVLKRILEKGPSEHK